MSEKRMETAEKVYSHTATETKPGHLFQPGKSGNPGGRPKLHRSDYLREVVYGLAQEYPVTKLLRLLAEADTIATQRASWRGKVAIAQFILEQTVGKPVARQMGDTSQHDMLSEMIAAGAADMLKHWKVAAEKQEESVDNFREESLP